MQTDPAAPGGVLRLSVDVAVDAAEMGRWPEGAIRSFFDGIAQASRAVEYARRHISEHPRAHAD